MKKKVTVLILLLLAAASAFFLWFFLRQENSPDLVLYGNVDHRVVDLAFIDSERIAAVLVEEGDEVRAGQVLASLETRRLRDQIAALEGDVGAAQASLTRLRNGTRPEEVDQARAAVAAARADANYASQQFSRFNAIWKETGGAAVSQQDLESWRSRHLAAQANLVEAQKSLTLAELGPRWEDIAEAEAALLSRQRTLEQYVNRLADAELRSPLDSVVRSRLLEPGDMASPQKPVFTLAVMSPKWVRAYISETDRGFVKTGMTASVTIDSFPDRPVPGKVGFISELPEFTPKTVQTPDLRTALVYEIRVYVDDPDNVLHLGVPATVTFADARRASGE